MYMVFVSLEMIIDFLNFPELNGYIYTFGEYAEVLEPLKLRNTMSMKIEKMLKRYL